MKKFGIYAWPAYATKAINPYNYLIYKNIENEGFPVYDFSLNRKSHLLEIFLSSRYKILHMHWPSSNVLKVSSTFGAWKRLITFFLVIKTVKLLGKKIFWTVHNFEDHENQFPRLQDFMDKLLYRNVDGFISMNKPGLELIKEKLITGTNKKVSYIPHPHYKGYYKNRLTRQEARAKLGIDESCFVFLFFGQIRSYKNVPALIKVFKSLNYKNSMLLIAGKLDNDVSLSYLTELIGNAKNIKFYNSFIKDDDIQLFLNSADLVVIPYNKIFNSGSALLSLSFNRPTLVPDMYALSELKEMIGSKWIKTYTGELSNQILENAMIETLEERSIRSLPDIDLFSPNAVAKKTIGFYQSLL